MDVAINCGGKTYQECSSCDVHKLINALLRDRYKVG
jgi:hypothetical protein